MQIVYLLFEDIKYRQEDNKFKPLHEIQKLVAEQFKEITGLTAPHSDFLSVSRTFVNILNIKEKTQRHTLKKKQNLKPFFIKQNLSIIIYLSSSILKMFPTVFG